LDNICQIQTKAILFLLGAKNQCNKEDGGTGKARLTTRKDSIAAAAGGAAAVPGFSLKKMGSGQLSRL